MLDQSTLIYVQKGDLTVRTQTPPTPVISHSKPTSSNSQPPRDGPAKSLESKTKHEYM
mgnify:CR=1 FL=1